MIYHGVQFRMARAAAKLRTRAVCKDAAVSMTTLARVEGAAQIEYGVREQGRFEEATIEKLVAFYEERGVVFLQGSQQGVGIRYRPNI